MDFETTLAEILRRELQPLIDKIDAVTEQKPLQDYLTTSDFCKLTGYRESTVAQLRHKGRIPYIRMGNKILYRRADCEEFIYNSFIGNSKERKERAQNNQRR